MLDQNVSKIHKIVQKSQKKAERERLHIYRNPIYSPRNFTSRCARTITTAVAKWTEGANTAEILHCCNGYGATIIIYTISTHRRAVPWLPFTRCRTRCRNLLFPKYPPQIIFTLESYIGRKKNRQQPCQESHDQ